MAAQSSSSRFNVEEKEILVFTGVAHGLTHYVELTYPTLAVFIAAESSLPLEQVLGWSLIGYALFGLGALPAGIMADRIGSKPLVVLGIGAAGLSSLAAAMVPVGWPLGLCLAGIGLGASTYHPAGMGLISRAVRARGAALGINGIYGNVGIALAPMTTSLLANAFGWRATFALTGGLLVVAAIGGQLLPFRDPPRAEVPAESVAGRAAIPTRRVVIFIVLCLASMLAGFSYRANTVAQPALFSERIAILDFGMAATIAMLFGVAGQYLGGRIADRFSLVWGYFAFHLLSLPMLLLMTVTFDLPLLVASSLFVFFALGMQPIENSLYAQLTPERWRSTAYGLKFTLTFGIGSSAVVMVRAVAGSSGFVGVYHFLVGVVVLIVLLALAVASLSRRLPREPAIALDGVPLQEVE